MSKFRILPVIALTAIFNISIAQTNHPVISQVFGGGGTSATVYNNDFVELFNPTALAVSLSGWSLQYAIGGSTTYVVIALTGSLPARGYYLIGLGRNTTATGPGLPAVDFDNPALNIGATGIKIGLVNNTTPFTTANPSASAVDFVGIGTTTGFETAPTAAGSITTSIERKAFPTSTAASLASGGADEHAGNGYDSDDNSSDFVIQGAILARNSTVQAAAGPLPLRFTGLSAAQSGSSVKIQWTVADETGIERYSVERSTDGHNFATLFSVNGQGKKNYTWVDLQPGNANNYYRIKYAEQNGANKYSATLNILLVQGVSGFTVFPNPVVDDRLNVQLNNMPRGSYLIQLINAGGQEVYRNSVQHDGGSYSINLAIAALRLKGAFNLRISNGRMSRVYVVLAK